MKDIRETAQKDMIDSVIILGYETLNVEKNSTLEDLFSAAYNHLKNQG